MHDTVACLDESRHTRRGRPHTRRACQRETIRNEVIQTISNGHSRRRQGTYSRLEVCSRASTTRARTSRYRYMKPQTRTTYAHSHHLTTREATSMPSAWSTTDRRLLFTYVEKYGATSWNAASQHVPGKTPKQCRDQWYRVLAPLLKRAIGGARA